MAHSVIEVRNVSKYFGEIRAVDGVSLTVEEGEIFGLIGHNGAGKSTLFKLMLGLMPLTSGEIHISGKPVRGEAFRQVRRGVGYLPENVVFYDNLTGMETLWFFADLKGVDRSECKAVLEKVGLTHAANRRVRGYSKGMRQRLGFAQALLGSPAIMFLDEPTTGLDPEGIREFYCILQEMRAQGVTMILTSHILAEIQERVDRIAMIKSGNIQAMGTVQSLREMVDLPLHFVVRARHGALQSVQEGMARCGVSETTVDKDQIRFDLGRERKMAFMAALTPLMADIADIQIKEPSLEDVFLLGYAKESDLMCATDKAEA